MRNTLKTIGVVVVVVAAFVAGQFITKSSVKQDRTDAQKLGASVVDALVTGKPDEAYKKYSSNRLREGQTVDEFKATFTGVSGATTTKDSGSVYIGESNALYLQSVAGDQELTNGNTSGLVHIILEKENGQWKVLSAAVQ